ncbi:unnamed protein product [Rotaria sordida]|uniref:Centrosomin N-terminal motif 1 domain-containing protein n=1 Tax=Rotaria sordida TaxID=392033 RepID=A0A814MCP3_9BILA|nr:unnamed protein product [Rotaria sordida]CAF1399369.1 unnamed protein product [Rotaria sordida]
MTDEEFQELKRENFSLKLRIYFLEEQNQSNFDTDECQTPTSYVQQLQNEIERLQQCIQSQSVQTDNCQTVCNIDYEDERRALHEELNKIRRENASLKKSLELNYNKSRSDEREQSIIKPPTVSLSIHAATSTDSGLITTMPGMSNTFLSSSALQIELNEYKERERKLEEQVNSLRRQLETSLPQTNETLAELDRARQQIQQYEVDIKNYEQQQSKSERVLQRLQADYEARIATLVEQQRQQTTEFDTYRHEPLFARIRFLCPLHDETSPTINIEEYRQAINQRDHIIQQLEEAINEITIRLRTPFTMMLPTQSSTSQWLDEHSLTLIRELNSQMQTHLETVDQLRAECVELRRSEKNLRNQVDSLTQLINTPNRNVGFPPVPRPSPSSSKTIDTYEDARQVQDLQSVVVQITLRLQSDAENVSGLTNRVAQMIRERDEWQEKMNRLNEEIEKRNVHIRQLEQREPEFESRIRQQFLLQIEILQRDIISLEDELKNRDHLLHELRSEKNEIQTRKEHERFDQINNQEGINLQGQLRTANETLVNLEQELVNERRQYDDLRRQYDDLHRQYEKFERIHTSDEIQSLRRENQAIKERYRDVDNKILELKRRNDELKSQISVYEIRVHENVDTGKQYQHELAQLKHEIQDILREREDRIREINEWRHKYEIIKADLSNVQYEKERIISERQTINNENTKLKHDIDDLTIRIRVQIQQEIEDEYRQLNNRRETEILNIRKDKETVQYDLEQLSKERIRLSDRLQAVEYSLKQAYEKIEIYAIDIDRLKKALNISQVKNEEIERDLSRAYTAELKTKTNRIHDLENKYRSVEQQLNEFEKIILDLRQENIKLGEYNERLQREYDQYRLSQQKIPDSTQQNLTVSEERIRKEIIQATQNKQELIDILERKLLEKENIIKELQHARCSFSTKDLHLDLEIEIEQLEPQDAEAQAQFYRNYTETTPGRDRQIEKFSENTQQIRSVDNTSTIGTLPEQYQIRDRQREQELTEKNLTIKEYERRIGELQTTASNHEREIQNTNVKLQQIEQTLNTQQNDFDTCRQKRDILNVDLNIAIEENEVYSERIKHLEKQLEMSQIRSITPEQVAQYQNIIDDLKAKLRHQEDTIQTLQRTISDSDSALKETRHTHQSIQSDYNRTQLRYEQMENQYKADLGNRDQTIASLRKRIIDKDQEIDKLRQSDIAKEAVISQLRSKSRESDIDSRSEYSGARAPTNVALRLELQKKDDQIDELKRQLERARRDMSLSGRDDSSTIQHAKRVDIPHRHRSTNFDHLNREELLYELEMALQDNQQLVQQLATKTPNITELHNQLLDVRKELARQKYVNQVLWRKLDALIDIQGSNTRAELAIELANYHDELEALKAKQHRTNDTRLAMLNAISRSSSELNISILNNDILLSTTELSSKNIKSTIEPLHHSNIEWREKFSRLKEKYYRCEYQSRNYYRKLIKYYKLLYDAGLIDSSSIRQRRHSAEDSNRKFSTFINMIKSNEEMDNSYNIKNIEELQEIIHNQKKYIEQLQLRVRLNTPDIIQSTTLQQLTEQNKNLNLVIETYKNESNILKNELEKLNKTNEYNRITLQQYQNLIKKQQNYIEQINKQSNQHEQLSKRHDLHPAILNEKQNRSDNLIIDLNKNILLEYDKIKKTSLNKKDSGVESVVDSTRYTLTQQEYQRQITDKDDRIRQLTKELNDLKRVHENEINQYRLKSEKTHTDLIDDLNVKQNDLRQARLQIDLLKSTKTQLEQAQDQNQRLQTEIKLLQTEINNKKGLIDHYENQINLLEKQVSYRDGGKGEMTIRTSEMSELLEEMRRLRHDLERSIHKQNELQAKLDENMRLSNTAHEFTFSGRGVSHPDLRIMGTSRSVDAENISLTNVINEKRSRPLGSSTTELETEKIHFGKKYIVGELDNHENLRRLIADIKIELKAIEVKIKERLRSRSTSSTSEPSIEWLEHRLNSLNQCLIRLEQTYRLIESYWPAYLPIKNSYDEHQFNDPHLADENKELRISQSKYIQELQNLKQKYKEQSVYMDQVLSQLTKANHKKANTDDYLALLLRPTLDVLQKARSNIEHHLKESNNINNLSPSSIQSHHHRTDRLD